MKQVSFFHGFKDVKEIIFSEHKQSIDHSTIQYSTQYLIYSAQHYPVYVEVTINVGQ